jgi:hypothetical protein
LLYYTPAEKGVLSLRPSFMLIPASPISWTIQYNIEVVKKEMETFFFEDLQEVIFTLARGSPFI